MERTRTFITSEPYSYWVGALISKRSKKPFKGGAKAVVVLELTINEHSDKPAFVVSDGTTESIVDCYQCLLKTQIDEI